MSQIYPSVIETIEFWYYFHAVVLVNSLLFHSAGLLKGPFDLPKIRKRHSERSIFKINPLEPIFAMQKNDNFYLTYKYTYTHITQKISLKFLWVGLCHMQVEKNASIYRHRYEATICHTHSDLKDLCRKRKLLFLIGGTSM